MRESSIARLLPALVALALALVARPASALDKQGNAHGAASTHADESGDENRNGFNVSGAAMLGVSLYNPSYYARPDNTGHTLFRYAAHADFDLIGEKLSIPLDLNVFTDGDEPGARKLRPSEGDGIVGVTSTWPALRGKVEIGARVEGDIPLDQGTRSQTYADVRLRYVYSLRRIWPGVGRLLVDGDISGWLTLGWFAINPSYAARPDNSGNALLRYAWHYELSVWHDHVSFGMDATFFTDRTAGANPVGPSELDFTPEVLLRSPPFEVHLAYESDHPVDRAGPVQEFVYALFVVEFDLARARPRPLEERTHIISP